jgi:hypothetical protein
MPQKEIPIRADTSCSELYTDDRFAGGISTLIRKTFIGFIEEGVVMGVQVAEVIAEKVLNSLGAGIYHTKMCEESEHQSLPISFFCKLLGGASGAADADWQEDVTERLDKIQTNLTAIDQQLKTINAGVLELLTQTKLLELELSKILQGQNAYKYLQAIQGQFSNYARMLKDRETDVAKWTTFFDDVINKYKLPEHLDQVKTAVITPLLDKESLLRVFVRKIAVQVKSNTNAAEQVLQFYDTFQAYVNSILLEMKKGYLLYMAAANFFEAQADVKKVAVPRHLSPQDWDRRKNRDIKDLVNAFNAELVWLILTLSWEEVGGTNPHFLILGAREMVARALRFTARSLGENYGLRGVILSMGERFTGKITVGGNDVPISDTLEVITDQKADFWTADGNAFQLSNVWKIYFYFKPTPKPGGPYAVETHPTRLPYGRGLTTVMTIDEVSGQRSNAAGSVVFGSFLEVERSGGGSALLGRKWQKQNPRVSTPDFSTTGRNATLDRIESTVVPVTAAGVTYNELHAQICSAGEVFWTMIPPKSRWGVDYSCQFHTTDPIVSRETGQFRIEGELRPLPKSGITTGRRTYRNQGIESSEAIGPIWSKLGARRGPMVLEGELDKKLVVRKLWFVSTATTKYGCELKLRVYVIARATKENAVVPSGQVPLAQWDKIVGSEETAQDEFCVSDAKNIFAVNLNLRAGTPYYFYVIPSVQVGVETSGSDMTPYFAYLGLQLTNLRIAKVA